jgi:hypothetical protein
MGAADPPAEYWINGIVLSSVALIGIAGQIIKEQYHTATTIPFMYSQKRKLRSLSPNFRIFACSRI